MGLLSSDSPMDRASRKAIEANIVNLSKRTKNLEQVLSQLEDDQALNLYDLTLIRKYGSNSEKLIKFYEIILKKDSSAIFITLMKTLLKTDNKDLVELLWTHDVSALKEPKRLNQSHNHPVKIQQSAPTEQTMVSVIVGIFVLGFTTSIPILLFLFNSITILI